MSRWRIAVVTVLLLAPFVALAAVGSYYLWQSGWGFIVWWPLMAVWALGYLLAWYWQRKRQLLAPPPTSLPLHWTDRDRQAWKLVEQRARATAGLDPDRLASVHFYLDQAQEMALELARHYHPGADDPLGPLTIPELLAVVELAAGDLAELVEQTVPAGHLLTVRDWRRARQLADWYRTASNAYWLASAIFSPLETGLRFAASRIGLGKPWEMFQQDLLVWFYAHFVHRLGTYLIELNSGRLKVGARRYRELTRTGAAPGAAASADVPAVTLTIVGQVKAGKSSLVNALLGEQRARTDVLPSTADITRYQLQQPGIATTLTLLDTVGYAHEGPREDQLRQTQEAARQSDLLLLVLHARNPAREADRQLLARLREWFAGQPHLRMPPVLAVLTHVDLLTPAMEWAPPYDWQAGQRSKEQEIRQAVAAVREPLGHELAGVVPVCTAAGKVWGIEDGLLPALAELLDDAHAVGLLRCLKAEADRDKIRRLVKQLVSAGRAALQLWRETRTKS